MADCADAAVHDRERDGGLGGSSSRWLHADAALKAACCDCLSLGGADELEGWFSLA